MCYSGLSVDFARQIGANTMIRGIRDTSDLTYERSLSWSNNILDKSITTIWIPVSQKFAHISSSLVRELLKFNKAVDQLVPEKIAAFIKENS